MIKTCQNPDCQKQFSTERSAVNYCSRDCSNKDRQRITLGNAREFNVLSCGGGVQSTAMIAMIYAGKLPRPDLVLMVDTGYEKHGTLDYAHAILIPACKKIGVEFKFLSPPDNRIFNDSGMILLPAYKRLDTGETQKLTTMCSGAWKAAVMRRYVRTLGVVKARSWIGISTDESERQKQSTVQWISNYYPLIEHHISRYQCLFQIRSLGWPDPARSSCIFCPSQSDDEYELMKSEYLEDYQRVVEVDNQIEQTNPNIFLHRSMMRMRDIIWRTDVMGKLRAMPPVPCEICQMGLGV